MLKIIKVRCLEDVSYYSKNNIYEAVRGEDSMVVFAKDMDCLRFPLNSSFFQILHDAEAESKPKQPAQEPSGSLIKSLGMVPQEITIKF